jgi:hypothetical protein
MLGTIGTIAGLSNSGSAGAGSFLVEGIEPMANTKKTVSKNNTNKDTGRQADKTGSADTVASGLQESSGEFRVGEKITFGMRNGNILLRRAPQGEEVEVGETTLAGLMIDAFFTDKFGGEYETVKRS